MGSKRGDIHITGGNEPSFGEYCNRAFLCSKRYIREGRRADRLLTFHCKILRLLPKILLFTLEDIMLALSYLRVDVIIYARFAYKKIMEVV